VGAAGKKELDTGADCVRIREIMSKRESERHRSVLYVRMAPKQKKELEKALVDLDLSAKEAVGAFAARLVEKAQSQQREIVKNAGK